MHEDVIVEYPQSGERFRGIPNVRAQFENYPNLGPGTTLLEEVIGGTTAYALTPTYTLVGGRRQRRPRHSDQPRPVPRWQPLVCTEPLRAARRQGSQFRTYFAPEFEPPEWREPFREAP